MTGEMEKSRFWKPEEIGKQSQLRFLRLYHQHEYVYLLLLVMHNFCSRKFFIIVFREKVMLVMHNFLQLIVSSGLFTISFWVFLSFYLEQYALGMEDSSIQIYNTRIAEVTSKLEGHQDRVTGLAFSIVLNALVSSGADGQIFVWSVDGWNKQASKLVHISSGRAPNPPKQNQVQFHQDQTHLLVFNENLIAIYEAPELKCIEQWFPGNSSGSVTCATYSCDSQSVYAAFESGNIIVFSAALSPQCHISPKAYFTASPSTRVYPLVIAAHPNDPNQFALGLSDGGVQILEPLDTERRWGTVTIS